VEKVIEIYDQTLEANPQDVESWWEKAAYLSALGRNEEALQAYDRIIELNSTKSSRAWFFEASIFDSRGRHNESLQAYDRAIELTPVDDYWRLANIWDQKGLALQRISEREAASEAFEKAALNYDAYLRKNPCSAEAWKNRGQDLYNLGRYEEALHSYERVIELNPKDADAWVSKGSVLQYGLKRLNDSIEAYEEATDVGSNNSNNPDVWKAKARALLVAERCNESLASYDTFIQIDPQRPDAWTGKGNALEKLGRHNEAMNAFEKALEIYDQNIKASSGDIDAWSLNGKGETLYGMGRYEEALDAYDKALEVGQNYGHPFRAMLWNAKGKALQAIGKDIEATAAFSKARELGYGDSASYPSFY
jgi:tetratricopeptide (TPR) repeat protein